MNFQILILILAVAALASGYLLYKKRQNLHKEQQVKLVEKTKLTHDTYLFTFLMENQTEPLGL